MNIKLSKDEYDVLQKIARKTKMDCWFDLDYLEYDQTHCVVDLENNCSIELSQGIDELMQGLDCIENYESCELDLTEELILAELLCKLQLPKITEYQVFTK